MEPFGEKWSRLEKNGAVWRKMEPTSLNSIYFDLNEKTVWRKMEPFGEKWRKLSPFWSRFSPFWRKLSPFWRKFQMTINQEIS